MIGAANDRISILRGVVDDDFADPADTETTVRKGVIASILEKNRTVQRDDSNTPQVIVATAGRVAANTDIRPGDRVKSELTGRIYIVDDVVTQPGLGYTPDMRLDLRRVT